MFFPESEVRVWLNARPTDMRKSYDGLSALVKNQLLEDPLSGQMFIFINRRRSHLKALYFDRTGYCIGFYPVSTDGLKTAESFWSCVATLRRILEL